MSLNKSEVDRIAAELLKKGLSYGPIKDELIDDVASAIEIMIEQGHSFEHAFAIVVNEIDKNDITELQRTVINTLKSNRQLKRFEIRSSLLLALSLFLWVAAEYIWGLISGKMELGAIYGLLSIVIMAYWLYTSLRTINGTYFEAYGTFKNLFYSGFKISWLSATLFTVTLLLFWTYIYPDYYLTFQMSADKKMLSETQLLVASLIGSGIGIFVIGLILSILHIIIIKRCL